MDRWIDGWVDKSMDDERIDDMDGRMDRWVLW